MVKFIEFALRLGLYGFGRGKQEPMRARRRKQGKNIDFGKGAPGSAHSCCNRSVRGKWRLLAAVGLLFLAGLGSWIWDYFDPSSIAHQSIRLQLRLLGESIYEYRKQTGRWPAKLDDLGQTSLPAKSPYWRAVNSESTVVLWPKDMPEDPQQNGKVLLAYYTGGRFSKFGRVWVCWGDLRTEFGPVSAIEKAAQRR
jgi:hypothetical protein